MDEYSAGMDPEVRKYFRKIINSFSAGLMWMIVAVTSGLYFGLAIIRDGFKWYNGVFYVLLPVSFILLLRYLHRLWKGR